MPASGQVRLVDTRGPNTVTLGRGAAPQAGLLHHSDRGSQYASRDYRRLLAQRHISRTAKCYDNAMKERFVATLKVECAIQPFASRAAARLAIFDFTEVWYKRQRVHSSLGYRSPANFEAQFAKPLH